MSGRRSSLPLAFAAFTALRLLVFVVPLLVIWAFSGNLAVAAVVAAVIGLALSYILLDRQRGVFANGLQERASTRRRITDETVEDELADDDQSTSSPASPKP
jgi:ABC-type bacteriocin/lantibiotic exporter with double-glycine peptidase domain